MASFEWDEQKNAENILKHGVSFFDAQGAFVDPYRMVFTDETHSTQLEKRWYCIGLVHGKPCTVRFTYRGKNIRIFGAGYWRKEKKLYET